MTAIVWLRRDLRLHDHPALTAALASGGVVVPVFCLDPRLLRGRHRSGPRTQFLLECLDDVDRSLRERGSGLVVRHGPPERELAMLAAQLDAREVHFTADISPYARSRGRRVAKALERGGTRMHAHPGLGVIDDLSRPLTRAGGPYTVFTAFHRAWEGEARREVLPAPRTMPRLPPAFARDRAAIPALLDLGLEQELERPAPGGERHARNRLERFLAGPVTDYAERRDSLAAGATSRLSPYLHLGCVSAREIERRLRSGAGAEAFRRQLCWRDFYHHQLLHFPANTSSEFQQRYRGRIGWSRSLERYRAWCDGRTGYPLVDAAMRQLRSEGWMHNRARMIVGSFLTKDLGIDWRWGERQFMRLLLDGDEASNNGNWQWIASVGTDRQPPARRIYNPTRQMRLHDPDGRYVRRHVPELGGVPDEHIHEPWLMPEEVQREAGCVIGRDYPEPLVGHLEARREALERYRAA